MGPKSHSWTARDIAPLATLAALIVFFAVVTQGGFLQLKTIDQILSQGSVLAIASAGMTFVLLCGEIDLAVGNLALCAACMCGWMFQTSLGKSQPWLCILAPLLPVALLGITSGALVLWSKLPSFIITLAMMNIAFGLAQLITNGKTYSLPDELLMLGNKGIVLYEWLQENHKGIKVPVRLMIPYSTVIAAAAMTMGHIVLQHTHFGRYLYMTGGNRQAATLAGVRCGRIIVATLGITALCGAVSGLLQAGRLGSASMDQNADLLLNSVACVVLGGTSLFGGEGGMGKTFVGVLTFTVLEVGLRQTQMYEPARPLVMGLVLMSALVLNGLLAQRRG